MYIYIYSFAIFAILPLYYCYITAIFASYFLVSDVNSYRVFPTGRMGGVPPTSQKFGHHLPPNFYSLLTKSQFNPIKKIKTSFLAVVIATVPFLYSSETQAMLIWILIDVQYSQNAVFSF